MNMLAPIIFVCALLLETTPARIDFKSRVGVVDNNNGQLCLVLANPDVDVGQRVNLVMLSKQQRIVRARVKEKLGRSCARTETTDESFYSLQLEREGDIDSRDTGVPLMAVISTKPLTVSRGRATGDLDKDGRSEFFRYCASNEGLHFTVWTGQPLVGRRRWHFYYYLGYDVVPSCKRKDYM
jgi:hypothetical protein